jgi:chromosome segregation ATPase
VSWFGGAALISGLVQSRIADKMEPAQRVVTEVTFLAKQTSDSLDEQRKKSTKLDDSLKDTNQRLDLARGNEQNLEEELKKLRSQAELAVAQINDRLKAIGQAAGQSDSALGKPEIKAKLDAASITVRFGGDVPAALAPQLVQNINASGKNTVMTTETGHQFVGASSLRYFYEEDEGLANRIAEVTNKVLQQFDIRNKQLPLISLIGQELKPPEHTLVLWLNISNGRLL